MSKSEKKKGKRKLPLPFFRNMVEEANINYLDEESFLELVEIAIEALHGRRFALPPDSERCLEEGPPGTLYLTGVPENQMGMSIVAECSKRFGKRKGQKLFQSFMLRWFAIIKAKHNGHLAEFTRQTGEVLEINTAVFRVAAGFPLKAEGRFEPKDFVARVREVIRGEEGANP